MSRITSSKVTLQNIKNPSQFVDVTFNYIGTEQYGVWLDETTQMFYRSTEWRVYDSHRKVAF